MTMKKKTAVIQVRVSSKGQAEKELPIESQLARCEDLAKRLGATVLRVFAEHGRSGYSGRRPEFDEAIEYCEKHFPDYFITWSTSRFSRKQAVSVTTRARLERIGTELVYASFEAGSDPDTRFLNIGLRELMDEYYSRQISRDTKRSMARNAESGFWNGGRPPFGYEAAPAAENSKRKRLVINDHEAMIVRQIFEMRINGFGGRSIAVALNEKGLKNRDRPWRKGTVLGVLRSHAVRGCVVYGKRESGTRRVAPKDQWMIVDSHEAIIDKQTWQKVQAMIDDSSPVESSSSTRSGYLFTGLVRCGKCGQGMQIETATGRGGKQYSYYNCRGALKDGSCQSRRIPADELDNFLLDVIMERILTRRNLAQVIDDMQQACGAWSKEQKDKIALLNTEYQELQVKNEKLYATIERMGSEDPDPALLLRRINLNDSRMQTVQAEIVKIENSPAPDLQVVPEDLDELAVFFRDIVRSSRQPQKIRAFFGALVERIVLEDRQAKIAYRPELLATRQVGFIVEDGWLPGTSLLRTRRITVDLPCKWHRRAA